MREFSNVLTLAAAVAKIDVGYIRRNINRLIPGFLGAKQNNYAKEMIWFRTLLTDSISDKVLQESILAYSVVNMSGIYGKAVASDALIKIHNKVYSEDMARKGNSTHNADATIINKAGNIVASRVVQNIMETAISMKGTTYYTKKKTTHQVLAYANAIQSEGFVDTHIVPVASSAEPGDAAVGDAAVGDAPGSQPKKKKKGTGLSDDIEAISMKLLVPTIETANAANKACVQRITRNYEEDKVDGKDALDRHDARLRARTWADKDDFPLIDDLLDSDSDGEIKTLNLFDE
ncbi:unnamed protein product [Zymoseptoria tritici ST99CH_1E4]|uniref:DUF6589 domain-containing protein n=1 Tax=Zymoseptoria tritici ST99CH_1E4 TaxID=1276532 RepID=A0A2H1H4M5_ZYMTR|nr:unnamed protein product [Zymoseptoria tritici ST99CH_1E4]